MISSIKRSNDFDDFDLALTKYEKGWEQAGRNRGIKLN